MASVRKNASGAALLALLGLLAHAGLACCADEKKAAPGDAPAKKATPEYFDISDCVDCHGRTKPEDAIICKLGEANIWKDADKHQQAYKILADSETAARMKECWKGSPDWSRPFQDDARCLACHAIALSDEDRQALKQAGASFKIEDGVSCAVCHGAAEIGARDDWTTTHYKRRNIWRGLKRAEKEAYGMRDLWDPVGRTATCVSCHIGNAGDGKVVTHEMYAAGHPPLPSVEIGIFSFDMPKHWEYLQEKDKRRPNTLKEFYFQHLDDEAQKRAVEQAKFEQTKLVLLGGAVAFRESVRLLRDQAAAAGADGSLDMAQFDCAACHHDLRGAGRPRSQRLAGILGRPQIRSWPAALVVPGIRAVGADEKAFDAAAQKLAVAMTRRAFGDPAEVVGAAAAVIQWTDDKLIDPLKKKEFDRDSVRKLLEQMPQLREGDDPDYDSARQLAWAAMVIAGELNDLSPAEVLKAADKESKLDSLMHLQLPAGAQRKIETDLPTRLKIMADYDSAKFKEYFQKFIDQLPKSDH